MKISELDMFFDGWTNTVSLLVKNTNKGGELPPSTFDDEETANEKTKETWNKGKTTKTFPNGATEKEHVSDEPVNKNGDTKVKVRSNTKGQMHGFPVPKEKSKKE